MIRKRATLSILFVLFLFSTLVKGTVSRVDSLGTIEINNVRYIIHKILPKETLSSISRKYGVSVQVIQYCNPGEVVLRDGSLLRVPTVIDAIRIENKPEFIADLNATKKNEKVVSILNKKEEKAPSLPLVSKKEDKAIAIDKGNPSEQKHIVKAGETLSAISRIYAVSIPQIRTWNPKYSIKNALNLGDTILIKIANKAALIVEKPIEQVTPIKKNDFAKPETNLNVNQKTISIPKNLGKQFLAIADNTGLFNSDKKLGLHKTLDQGSIVKLINKENGRIVYILIDGQMPESPQFAGIELIISKSAALQIGVKDLPFKAEFGK